MFKPKQPALRHFAVLECLRSGRFGAIWGVRDRRGSTKSQFLLVPSRVKPWPVLMTRLEKLQPIPVRLRNGNVGLLLSGIDLDQLTDFLKPRSRTVDFHLDALHGFVIAKRARRAPRVLLLGLCVVFGFSLVLLPQNTSRQAAVSVPMDGKSTPGLCAEGPQVNHKIEGSSKRFSPVQLGKDKYTIASVKRLGGLAQLKIKRKCDSKFFRIDAWIRSSEVIVSKVY
jgi:hypothetical protein